MSHSITGGCYCGSVRFQANPPVLFQALCHCDSCRRSIGAQSVAWITVESRNFEYITDRPQTFLTDTGATRSFCSKCGTSLTYTHPRRPTHTDITVGSLDHPESYPPSRDVFPEERLPWTRLCAS